MSSDGNTHLYDIWLSDSFEEELMDMARRGESKRDIANRARELTEEEIGLGGFDGFTKDLLSWALDDIDWWQIATDIEDQVEAEEEEEEEEEEDYGSEEGDDEQ